MKTMSGVRLLRVASTLSAGSLIGLSVALAAWAQEIDRVFFLSLPRLLRAETTFNRVANSNAVYFLMPELPENAGSGVQQVQIAQKDGASRTRMVRYEEVEAFVGTPDDRGADLAVAYPTGAADRGQFLGYGRLDFYNGDS